MKKLFFTAALAMLSVLAFAQSAGSDISGTVFQPGNAVIPGVTITLTGEVTGQKLTVSSAQGDFRFLNLSPGVYELKFEKGGFRTLIYKGVRMFVGKNKQLHVEMPPGPALPEMQVAGASGAIDISRPTKAANITKEMLRSLPTARNPWTIINLVPGMMIDRKDIGGNESGQQSAFYGLGADGEDTTWYIDGVNVTDPSAIGAAPAYLDTNSYEEIQVTMGANDITAQTGGTQLNFVTRRGGNSLRGDIYVYAEEEEWEMSQTLPQTIIDRGWGSPGVYRLYQYGANFGGAIIPDRLWFFGSYGIQDVHARTIVQTEDATWLQSYYGKINFQFGATSGMLQYSQNNKKKWGRAWIGVDRQSPETLWTQTGPGATYLGSIQQEMGTLVLNAKVAYQDGGFTLDPRSNKDGWMQKMNQGIVGPDWYEYYIPGRWLSGGCMYYTTNRNSLDLSLDGNFFLAGVLPGDHEIRFGVDYYTSDTTSQTLYPNHRRLFIYDRYNPAGYKEIWWSCDTIFDVGFERISFYLSDTVTFGSLTANVGLRYDKETGSHNAATAPALLFDGTTPIYPNHLGAFSVPAKNIPAAFEVFSPRAAVTFDIFGNGSNVIKASYARYGSQSGNSLANHVWVLRPREVDVYWDDNNGDLVPQLNEFSQNPANFLWWNINLNDPYNPDSRNQFDPGYNSPILTEITLSFERALGQDFVAAVNAYYKKATNLTWNRGLFTEAKTGHPVTYAAGDLETAANWYQAGIYMFNDGSTKPWYQRYYWPDATYRTNYGSGTYNLYTALQFVLSKKLANNWMLDASFTYSDWKSHYDAAEYFDQTNFGFYDGGACAFQSGGPGLYQVYVNSRWQFRLAGLIQLPFGFNLTGVFHAREGYVIPYFEYFHRGGGLAWTEMYEVGKKMGDDRLPTLWVLNLGLEKMFNISPTVLLTLFVNGYNITNNATTLKVEPQIGTAQDDILRILNPGIFQFGVRVSF